MQEMKRTRTEQEIREQVEIEIVKRTLTKIIEKFKLKSINNTLLEIIKTSVSDALSGSTPHDVVLTYRFSESFCEKCGECCRRSDPIMVNVRDLINIALFLGVSFNLVVANYTKTLKDGKFSLRTNPCPFFETETNECSVYLSRPNVCKTFPLQPFEDKLVLKIFDYCAFGKNLVAAKAYAFAVMKFLEYANPELHKKIERNAKKLQDQVPNGWAAQVKFIDKLLVPQKKKTK